jgi:hypothetical protein
MNIRALKTRRYAGETVAAECEGPLRVVETNSRDAIKCGKRTIAYLAIGAEAWGPLLAASVEMREALEDIVNTAPSARDGDWLTRARAVLAKCEI